MSWANFLPQSWRKNPVRATNWGNRLRLTSRPSWWALAPFIGGIGAWLGYTAKHQQLQAMQVEEDQKATPRLQRPDTAEQITTPETHENRPANLAWQRYDGTLDPALNPYMPKNAYPHVLPTWLLGAQNSLTAEDKELSKLIDLLKNRRFVLPKNYYTVHDRITTKPEDIYNEIPVDLKMNIWFTNEEPDRVSRPIAWLTDEELRQL